MPMNKSTSNSSIVIGIIELVLGGICVICGIVSMSKLTSPVGTTIGLWALYFAIPGILCIVAGFKNDTAILGISLGMNVIGIILAGVAVLIGGILWTVFNHSCYDGYTSRFSSIEVCTCIVNGYSTYAYATNCSDLMVVRNATAVATVMYILLIITSLTGSIFGCVGTCCAPRAPNVIVTHAVPAGATFVVSSNQQSTIGGPSYPAAAYPASYPAASYPAGSYPASYPTGAQQGYAVNIPPPGYEEQCKQEDQLPTKQ